MLTKEEFIELACKLGFENYEVEPVYETIAENGLTYKQIIRFLDYYAEHVIVPKRKEIEYNIMFKGIPATDEKDERIIVSGISDLLRT